MESQRFNFTSSGLTQTNTKTGLLSAISDVMTSFGKGYATPPSSGYCTQSDISSDNGLESGFRRLELLSPSELSETPSPMHESSPFSWPGWLPSTTGSWYSTDVQPVGDKPAFITDHWGQYHPHHWAHPSTAYIAYHPAASDQLINNLTMADRVLNNIASDIIDMVDDGQRTSSWLRQAFETLANSKLNPNAREFTPKASQSAAAVGDTAAKAGSHAATSSKATSSTTVGPSPGSVEPVVSSCKTVTPLGLHADIAAAAVVAPAATLDKDASASGIEDSSPRNRFLDRR